MKFRIYLDIFLMVVPLAMAVYLFIWHKRNDPKTMEEIPDPQAAKKTIRRGIIGDVLLYLLVVALVLGGLLGCISRVDGTSMDHTLHHGQRLIGLRTEYNPWQRIERGDIVVVKSKALGKMLVKRVIGVPGDEVRIADNQVYVNGVLLEEDYIAEPMRTEDGLWILNEEQYFLLGDNRNVSNDSRYLGPVTQKEMYAVMIFDLSGFSKIERPAVYETLA